MGLKKRKGKKKKRFCANSVELAYGIKNCNLTGEEDLSPPPIGLATCDIIIRSSSRINYVEPVSWVLSDQRKR